MSVQGFPQNGADCCELPHQVEVSPSGPVGSATDRPADVCRCGRGRHPHDPERCAGGHPWRGMPGPALVVGSHSRAFWVAQAQARQAEQEVERMKARLKAKPPRLEDPTLEGAELRVRLSTF